MRMRAPGRREARGERRAAHARADDQDVDCFPVGHQILVGLAAHGPVGREVANALQSKAVA